MSLASGGEFSPVIEGAAGSIHGLAEGRAEAAVGEFHGQVLSQELAGRVVASDEEVPQPGLVARRPAGERMPVERDDPLRPGRRQHLIEAVARPVTGIAARIMPVGLVIRVTKHRLHTPDQRDDRHLMSPVT